jgi:hypothetical protein
MGMEMPQEWNVYNFYLSSTELFDEIVEDLSSYSKDLIASGEMDGFYYNRYNFPPTPPYLRFGCHNLKEEEKLMKKVDRLIDKGRITRREIYKPDLTDVDGVIMDYIKLTARKITETIKADLGKNLTIAQAAYLIHLTMNNFLWYQQEREIYSGLVKSMKNSKNSRISSQEDLYWSLD